MGACLSSINVHHSPDARAEAMTLDQPAGRLLLGVVLGPDIIASVLICMPVI